MTYDIWRTIYRVNELFIMIGHLNSPININLLLSLFLIPFRFIGTSAEMLKCMPDVTDTLITTYFTQENLDASVVC